MELTWIAIIASLLMGAGALLIFVWAVKSRQFHSFEDVKYQVFWSDAEAVPAARPTGIHAQASNAKEEQQHG